MQAEAGREVDKETDGEPDKDVEQAERQGEGKAERQDEKWIKRQAEGQTKTWSRQRGRTRSGYCIETGGEPDKDVEQIERQDEKWIKRQADSWTKTERHSESMQRACREAELVVEHKESRQSVRERCFLPWGMRVRIVLHRHRLSPSKQIQERCRTCRLRSSYFNGWVVFVLHTQIMIM